MQRVESGQLAPRVGVALGGASAPHSPIEIVAEGVIWKNPYPGSQARVALKGSSVNLGGGVVLHAMQVGQARTSCDSRCVLTRSDDSGRTWSEPWPVVIEDDSHFQTTGAMLAWQADRSLLGVIVSNTYVSPEDARWQKANGGWIDHRAVLATSIDEGRSWKLLHAIDAPAIEGGFFAMSSPPLSSNDGTLMIVIEPMFRGSMDGWNHEASVMFSRDEGRTWPTKAVIAKDPSRRIFYFDPKITRLASGRWLGMLWTHDTRSDQSSQATLSTSADGLAWSAVQSTPLWGFLTVPVGLPDGRVLAIYNHRRAPQGIRCCISEDEGHSWNLEHETVLWDQAARRVTGELAAVSQPRRWEGSALEEMFATFDFGVPHAMVLDDGAVLVTYYATGLDHIMHQRYVRLKVH